MPIQVTRSFNKLAVFRLESGCSKKLFSTFVFLPSTFITFKFFIYNLCSLIIIKYFYQTLNAHDLCLLVLEQSHILSDLVVVKPSGHCRTSVRPLSSGRFCTSCCCFPSCYRRQVIVVRPSSHIRLLLHIRLLSHNMHSSHIRQLLHIRPLLSCHYVIVIRPSSHIRLSSYIMHAVVIMPSS